MKSKSPRKYLAIFTMSFGLLYGACVVPAYGQQEVQPDWFDPWTPPASAQAAQPLGTKAAQADGHAQERHAKVKRVSASPTAKVHRKSAKKPA